MSIVDQHFEIDPTDIGIALAMRGNGFSEDDIVGILGYMPDLSITPDELDDALGRSQDLTPPTSLLER